MRWRSRVSRGMSGMKFRKVRRPRAAAACPRSPAQDPAPDGNPLQRLIRQRLDERGLVLRAMSPSAAACPGPRLYTLATTRNLGRPPRPVTLNGLAWGLDLPVSVVRSAAAASTGLHYYDDEPAAPEPDPEGDRERELLTRQHRRTDRR